MDSKADSINSTGFGTWYMAGVHAMSDGLEMMAGARRQRQVAGMPSREEMAAYVRGYMACRRVVKKALTPSPSPCGKVE